MKPAQLQDELDDAKEDLKEKIHIIGATNASWITQISQSDISNFLAGRRNWSYEKILRVSDILEKYKR